MEIQLIKGEFEAKEALNLITQMIHIKVRYHESKIDKNSSEEDIKYRETKIKMLQKELFELKGQMDGKQNKLILDALVKLEIKN